MLRGGGGAGLAALMLLSGCASSEAGRAEKAFRRDFGAAFRQYRQYEPAKALALARDENGNWAYGYAQGRASDMAAVNAASEECERQRARYGVATGCRTYAVGREIVGDASLVPAE